MNPTGAIEFRPSIPYPPDFLMNSAKKTVSAMARLAIGLAIIVYLLRKIETTVLLDVVAASFDQWHWLVYALFFFLACLAVGGVRWKLILDAQGLRMSWGRTFCVYFIGHFFNSFMFGATGGDLVRAFYATRETHHRKTEAVATIIIDRMIGMIALLCIAGVMLVMKSDFYLSGPETRLAGLLMLLMIISALLGSILLLNIRRFGGSPLLRWVGSRPGLGPAVRRTATAFELYRRRTKTITYTALLSFSNHIFIIFMCYCLGKSLQVHLDIIGYFTVIPVIMAIAAIPITPGGLGVREGVSVTLLGAMGVSKVQALPLSLMVYALMLAWGIVGGAIFLGYSASAGHGIHDEMTEIRKEAAAGNAEAGL